MSTPKPVVQGHLSTAPLAHVLLSLHRRGMSGTLAVWPEDDRPGQDRLLLANGYVVGARLLEPASSLERGILPLFRRENAPYAFYNLNLLGDGEDVVTGRVHPFAIVAAAVRGGAREDAVTHVLARHGHQRLRLALGLDLAPFELVPKERTFLDLLRAEPAASDALAERSGDPKVARRMLYLLSITDGLEAWSDQHEASDEVSELLPGLDSLPPGVSDFPLSSGFGASLTSRPSEVAARPAPAPGSTAGAAPRVSAMPAAPGQTLGGARAKDERQPTTKRAAIRIPAPPPPPPAPPPNLSAELTAKWKDLALEAVAIDGQNYFQMFGLPDSADGEQARDAYFAAVKRWHPDRLPPELEPLRPCAEEVFRQLTEAKDTLTDEEKRNRYRKIARDGGGTPASDRKLIAILTAAQEFEKANVLSNRGRFDEALESLDVVLELDPDQADHYALKAWAKLHMIPPGDTAPLEEVVSLCDDALRRAPKAHNERALYTKALTLKRLGKDDQAYACFRAVVENNPRHVEAAREMRLHEMRSRGAKADASKAATTAEPSKASALFSKLWPGKKP